jgi:hypothetical protein
MITAAQAAVGITAVTNRQGGGDYAGGGYGGSNYGGWGSGGGGSNWSNQNWKCGRDDDPNAKYRKKMHCPICEYAGQAPYITNIHDKETCSHPGGDMGGQSRDARIEKQKRINDAYFRAQKAKEEGGRDYNARKAKSARTGGNNSVQANALTTHKHQKA